MDVSIVIPVGREDSNLCKRIIELRNNLGKFFEKFGLTYEIIAVSDVFDVHTLKTLISLCNSGIHKAFFLSRRVGKGGSIKNVVNFARGEYIILLDADIPVSVETISYAILLAKKLGLDVLTSIRIYRDLNLFRRFLSVAYNCIVNILFRTGVKEHQSGFKILSRRATKLLLLGLSRSDDLAYDTELIVWSKKLGLRLGTLEVVWREKRGRSTIRLARAVIPMFLDIIILRLLTVGRRYMALQKVAVGKVYSLNGIRPLHVEFITILRCSGIKRQIFDIIRKVYVGIVSRC